MRNTIVPFIFLSLLACSGLPTKNENNQERIPAVANKMTKYQIDEDGAWCWFGDPRAVANKEATFVSYLTKNGNVVISKYNHDEKQLTKFSFPITLSVNDHNNPSLLLLNDGNLMIFFSKHNGESMYYSKTKTPGDIYSFERLQTLPIPGPGKGFTYPNPVTISDKGLEKIFLFWRGSDWRPTYSTSTDEGKSWSSPKSMVKNGNQRPYVKYFADSLSRIHITMTDGHPAVNPSNGIYYMYFKDGNFYKADGSLIGSIKDIPFNLSQLDKVYTPTANSNAGLSEGRAWTWSITTDKKSRPMIAYSVSPAINKHDYYLAHWSGSNWVKSFVTSGGDSIQKENSHKREDYYSGGIFFDQQDPDNLYLAKEFANGNHVIQEWTMKNNKFLPGGNLSSLKESSYRPFVPLWKGKLSRQNSFKVLWMTGEYEYYTDYDTGIKGIISEDPF